MRRIVAPSRQPDIKDGRGAKPRQHRDFDRDIHHHQRRSRLGDPGGDAGGAGPQPLMVDGRVVQTGRRTAATCIVWQRDDGARRRTRVGAEQQARVAQPRRQGGRTLPLAGAVMMYVVADGSHATRLSSAAVAAPISCWRVGGAGRVASVRAT